MTIKGIDVSEHQGNIDWAKVKGNVSFVILRAGYGDAITYPNQIDRTFEKNYKGCKNNNIPCGVYWYSYAQSGKAFCDSIVKAFCGEIEKAGYYAGLYMSRSPLQNYISSDVAKRYTLWIAEYNSKCNYNGKHDMWQYSSSGTVPGIPVKVDLNLCLTDWSDWGKN